MISLTKWKKLYNKVNWPLEHADARINLFDWCLKICHEYCVGNREG